VEATLECARESLKEQAENQSDPEFREGLSLEFWSRKGADQNVSLVVPTLLATPMGLQKLSVCSVTVQPCCAFVTKEAPID
jgi:hypothetical protein